MTDPRSSVVTAIRTRLATVTGLWPVAYQGGPAYTPTGVPYLSEQFAFGQEDDAAMRDPTTGHRWRDATENYQLELFIPVEQDIRVATEQGGVIARTFLDSTLTLTDGSVVWFTTYRLTPRGIQGGWQKFVLVLTYRYIFNA